MTRRVEHLPEFSHALPPRAIAIVATPVGETVRVPSTHVARLGPFHPEIPLAQTSDLSITMVSAGASSSSQLHTHLPPGRAQDGFNITAVAYVSDSLGATAVTSLGIDGTPLTFASTPPDQVRYHSPALPRKKVPTGHAHARRTFRRPTISSRQPDSRCALQPRQMCNNNVFLPSCRCRCLR